MVRIIVVYLQWNLVAVRLDHYNSQLLLYSFTLRYDTIQNTVFIVRSAFIS